MRVAALSDTLVKPPVIKATLKKRDYNTDDIMQQVEEVLFTDVDDTRQLARVYTHNEDGLRQLFADVAQRITYLEDPNFYQWVQTPSFLWHHTRRGDCKSLTVFISSVLQNMGIPHYIRYTNYNFSLLVTGSSKKYKHVYPVALLNGREIPMDVVYLKQEGGPFGTEKAYFKKKDTYVEPGLYKLGTTEADSLTPKEEKFVTDVQLSLAEMEMALADIPDSVVTAGDGDITKMTTGQLERTVWKDRYLIYANQEQDVSKASQYREAAVAMQRGSMAGLYGLQQDPFGRQVEDILRRTERKNAPAFQDFTLKFVTDDRPELSGLFQKIGDFFKKVGDTFKQLWTKFVNWIWKGPAKKMGPYYLFTFADESAVRSPEIRRRIQEQRRSFQYILDKGKFSADQLLGHMMNGIKEDTGYVPQEIFRMAETEEIAALPAVLAAVGSFVVKAIGWVIQVIEKIINLFKGKKGDAGVIDESTASDINLLEEEARLQAEARQNGQGGQNEESGGGGAAWGLAALAVPLLLRAF